MIGARVWPIVYMIGSLPVIAYYAAGLAGWFYDYPMWLFVSILLALATPLVALLLKLPSAPTWNLVGLWVGAGMIVIRVLYGMTFADPERLTAPAMSILVGTIVGALAWASIWTAYFLKSEYISRTFAG